MPKNIEDGIKIGKRGETIYVQSIMIDEQYEGLGIIAFVYPMSKPEYPRRQNIDDFIENESPVPMVVIGETKENYICYSIATDMQYPAEDKALDEEYKSLKNEIIHKGFGFRTLNDELSQEKGDAYDIKIIGYIKAYDASANWLKIDEVEWLTEEDIERIEELGYDANMDLPNGFMIYNEDKTVTEYKVKGEAHFNILEYIGSGNIKKTNQEVFLSRMNGKI